MGKTSLAWLCATAAATTAAALALPAIAQNQLPDGNGKQAVQTACVVCHELTRVTNAGHTPDEWDMIVHNMVTMGASLKPEQVPVVSKYLASYFPAQGARPHPNDFRQRAGELQGIRAADARAFPHDPYAAADGLIWYSGQLGNVLGRVDPKTGQFKDYPLPSSSGPHGLMGDKDGNIWFTGNFAGYVGKLDPKTGQVTQYKTPGARDPHSLVFDQDGILWFTAQGANQVGRIDPKTGEVKMVPVPTRLAAPYGIVVSSKGVPFFGEFGANKIGSIDPKTMKITEYTLPNRDTRPRRIAITSDDVLWYGDYTRGYLGMYDPKTGKAKEWKSPAGAGCRALWHRGAERRDLLQRVRHFAQHAGALRSQNGKIPDLEDSLGRRHGAQHDADGGRQARARRVRREHGRAGGAEVTRPQPLTPTGGGSGTAPGPG